MHANIFIPPNVLQAAPASLFFTLLDSHPRCACTERPFKCDAVYGNGFVDKCNRDKPRSPPHIKERPHSRNLHGSAVGRYNHLKKQRSR